MLLVIMKYVDSIEVLFKNFFSSLWHRQEFFLTCKVYCVEIFMIKITTIETRSRVQLFWAKKNDFLKAVVLGQRNFTEIYFCFYASVQATKQCFKLQWYFKKSSQLNVTMHLYSKPNVVKKNRSTIQGAFSAEFV